ncbi:TIGR03086 family protein [Rhodococcus antarcticus]|jgi:uncharacterized protein (TIGR03086 family)|uniref:TIGR03086 family protein n=1 Tax=Rhodococcus antarcticus TaxID=2987751 RepID=A0ABY6P1H1_9NOCA|nr:TIGR03086 family protein [Rhodococcus antarcticus]UZJ25063.1 TIGR03086 family protein [Rhodococcus antarcticus]
MDERELFVLANRTLVGVVGRARPEQWEQVLPPEVTGRDVPFTLAQVVATHAHDDAWVPDMVAGRTMDEVGATAFDGDLLGTEDPAAAFASIGERAEAAVAGADLDGVAHCSFGDFPVREYLWQVIFFRGIRARDLARATGQDDTLPPALVEGMWEGLGPRAEQWRGYGVFPPPVPVPADAPLQDRLLGLVGRDPGA